MNAGAPGRAWPGTYASRAVTGNRAVARARDRLRAAVDRGVRLADGLRSDRDRADRQPVRSGLAVGLPLVAGATAITYGLSRPTARRRVLGARIVTSAVCLAAGTGLVLRARRALLGELRQAREVAGAAQRTLLRPLPPRIDGLTTAAEQLSADPGAAVGGDLYEVIATEHGVRVVMGDVRGHGIGAIGTVAAILGSFREAVYDEAELSGVLRRLDRAFARHLRERSKAEHPSTGSDPVGTVAEEFVTVLLLEIRRDGEVLALNCGHPWPYLLSGGRVESLAGVADPLPPLGPFPLPAELAATDCGRLLPGEALFLHTDGVEDARDASGRFFPLPEALAEATRIRPASAQPVLQSVLTQLLHHADGMPADDVALLILHNDRHPTRAPLGSRGTARQATTGPQPTNRR
ncbi:serine/threonine-protein phosphatase [Streptomyces phyllanthi]|uniref:Serine/threonine-protein phosphatase n=2 Tax=Streptomyces phyllanthi TaxID=1803180 RepID=A0A5N8VYJ8_9ACTN|nr:serine/threonine-protein phosphatase [Streptomyces phyllanthi]